MMDSESIQRVKVRNMVSLFENELMPVIKIQSTTNLKRAKSLAHFDRSKQKHPPIIYKSNENILSNNDITPTDDRSMIELITIEKELSRVNERLKDYYIYAKDSHIYFQNEFLSALTDIVNVESNDEITIINKKRELIGFVKKLNQKLNSMLPNDIRKSVYEHEIEMRKNLLKDVDNRTNTRRANLQSDDEIDSRKVVKEFGEDSNNNTNSAPQSKVVEKLRSLFERKLAENDGLHVFKLKRSQTSHMTSNPTLNRDEDRIVHQASIQRHKSMVEIRRSNRDDDEVDGEDVLAVCRNINIRDIKNKFEANSQGGKIISLLPRPSFLGAKNVTISKSVETLIPSNHDEIYENVDEDERENCEDDERVTEPESLEDIGISNDIGDEDDDDSSSKLKYQPISVEKLKNHFENIEDVITENEPSLESSEDEPNDVKDDAAENNELLEVVEEVDEVKEIRELGVTSL